MWRMSCNGRGNGCHVWSPFEEDSCGMVKATDIRRSSLVKDKIFSFKEKEEEVE